MNTRGWNMSIIQPLTTDHDEYSHIIRLLGIHGNEEKKGNCESMRDMEYALTSLRHRMVHIDENYPGILKQFDEAVAYLRGQVASQDYVDPFDAADFSVVPDTLLHSGPKTIAFWDDGTKTVISLAEGTPYDKTTAFCWALAKRIFGSTSRIKKIAEAVTVEQEPKRKNNKKPTLVSSDASDPDNNKQTEVHKPSDKGAA